jgi:hypothetical protein
LTRRSLLRKPWTHEDKSLIQANEIPHKKKVTCRFFSCGYKWVRGRRPRAIMKMKQPTTVSTRIAGQRRTVVHTAYEHAPDRHEHLPMSSDAAVRPSIHLGCSKQQSNGMYDVCATQRDNDEGLAFSSRSTGHWAQVLPPVARLQADS